MRCKLVMAVMATAAVFTSQGVQAGSPGSVTFSGATATYYQTYGGTWLPTQMIDGIMKGNNGWAIFRNDGTVDQTHSETALLTLATPLSADKHERLLVEMPLGSSNHELGEFGLAYTSDPTPTLSSPSTPFTIDSARSLNGTTFTSIGPGILLAGGPRPFVDTYWVKLKDWTNPITGIFLDAINDPANGLPTGGPGRGDNGNFVVYEFIAKAVRAPEPSTWAMMLAGIGGLGAAMRSRRKASTATA
jgi:hypothetical protein